MMWLSIAVVLAIVNRAAKTLATTAAQDSAPVARDLVHHLAPFLVPILRTLDRCPGLALAGSAGARARRPSRRCAGGPRVARPPVTIRPRGTTGWRSVTHGVATGVIFGIVRLPVARGYSQVVGQCISKQGFRYWVLGVGLCNAAYPIPNTQHLR